MAGSAFRDGIAPTGVVVDEVEYAAGQLRITARSRSGMSVCPRCDRSVPTVEAWLKERPEITIIARDRGGGYRHAAAPALPRARQVADRWHLMENASQAFLDAVRKFMRAIRHALQRAEPDLGFLTRAERLQYEGFKRRQNADDMIRELLQKGASIKAVVRTTGFARKTVRQVARGGRSDIFRTRIGSLDPWLATLDAEWRGGCHNGAKLWRRLKERGFQGGLRVVTEWATRRRRDEAAPGRGPRAVPSAQVVPGS